MAETAKRQGTFKERVVEDIATRLFAAEETARVAERDFAKGDIHKAYWHFRRTQADNNRVLLWDVARGLGRDVDRAVDARLKVMRGEGAKR
jgi:hypothetical protein